MANLFPSLNESDPLTLEVRCSPPAGFRLQSGQRLDVTEVRGRLHGPESGPLVVVAGGISSGRHAADSPDGPGWWREVVRDGGPIDTRRVRVLAFDFSPGRDLDQPIAITTTDQAHLLGLLLDSIGEQVVDAFVGASYGGCVGLAFAEAFPHRLRRLVVISAAHRAHPAATAWRGVQRRLLKLGQTHGCETEALELARELAMTTYRTAEEFADRFAGDAPTEAGGAYPVCDYLIARGQGYGEVTSAARWISLSDSLDRSAVTPERIRARLTLLGFTSDRLVPVSDLEELAARVPLLERFVQAPSLYGHDAFLKEGAVVADVLRQALAPVHAPNQEIAA